VRQQLPAGTTGHKHAHPAAALYHLKVNQALKGLGNRQRVYSQVCGNLPYRWQRPPFPYGVAQDHFGNPLPDLQENRLVFIELAHPSGLRSVIVM
jgi:hypothetical protein